MKVGSLEVEGNVFLAPMAGITDVPFRKIVEGFGVSALWTEMMSCHAVVAAFDKLPDADFMEHVVPVFCQVSGNDPKVMADAAVILQEKGAKAIDINMGCPARRIVQKGAGAALMQNEPLARRILAAVRRATTLPLTVKIRSGWDEKNQNASRFAKMLELEGADGIIVHSRVRSNRHSGPASLSVIRGVKESVEVPVIGNGGVVDIATARTMLGETGCDGIMIGRGALGRPWFPQQVLENLAPSTSEKRPPIPILKVIQRHYSFAYQRWGIEKTVRRMRKHLGWYSRGLPYGAEFRERLFRLEDPAEIGELVETFFGEAFVEQ
ncbi:MAG: tRNA dihydrouridine synthase DusB [Desulfomonilaceae bacterium]